MRDALARILADDTHTLSFLMNRETGARKSRHMHSLEPTVQTGHLVSRHAGEEERFALEDSTWNHWSSNRGETQGVIFSKTAGLIGDVHVEFRTALTWENAHQLPRGTIRSATQSHGWLPIATGRRPKS